MYPTPIFTTHAHSASSPMTQSSSRVSNVFNHSTSGRLQRHRLEPAARPANTSASKPPSSQAQSRKCGASINVRYPSRRRSRRLAESSRWGRLGGGPDHRGSTGHDAHLHLHSEMIRRRSKKGAVKRDHVAWIWRSRNGDQRDIDDAAAGWIKIHPAGAWQIDLRPGVSRPARRAVRRFLRIVEGDCEIPRGEARGETK